jgi:hypothetical protein
VVFAVCLFILDIVCNMMVSRRKYQNWNHIELTRGSVHNELCFQRPSSCLMWCEMEGNDTLLCAVMYSTMHHSKLLHKVILLFVQVLIFVLMWYRTSLSYLYIIIIFWRAHGKMVLIV